MDAENAILTHSDKKKDLKRQLKTGRGDKATSRAIRSKLKRVDGYIKAQRDQIFIWKCFGDALAFIYLDPLSVKHMFFGTDDYEVKPDAGSLLGKKGLAAEVRFLHEVLNEGVPAVLCDLTNTLRFGDVCLLGGSDPFPIEVKAGTRLNQRGKRQLAKLEKLHDFLVSDAADEFRGLPGRTIRMSTATSLNYNLEALNECIGKAKEQGHAIGTPEQGVTFMVIRNDSDPGTVMSELDFDAPVVYDLNHFKNGHSWAAYIPFLLSIRDADHALDFVEGRIYVLVFIEGRQLCSLFEDKEWEVRYRPNDEYPIQCLHRKTAAYFGVSSQFIARAAFEFLSLASIVSTLKPTIAHMEELAKRGGPKMKPEEFKQRLVEKFSPDDEWFDRILNAQAQSTN